MRSCPRRTNTTFTTMRLRLSAPRLCGVVFVLRLSGLLGLSRLSRLLWPGIKIRQLKLDKKEARFLLIFGTSTGPGVSFCQIAPAPPRIYNRRIMPPEAASGPLLRFNIVMVWIYRKQKERRQSAPRGPEKRAQK